VISPAIRISVLCDTTNFGVLRRAICLRRPFITSVPCPSCLLKIGFDATEVGVISPPVRGNPPRDQPFRYLLNDNIIRYQYVTLLVLKLLHLSQSVIPALGKGFHAQEGVNFSSYEIHIANTDFAGGYSCKKERVICIAFSV
jgi:hypothetical protein